MAEDQVSGLGGEGVQKFNETKSSNWKLVLTSVSSYQWETVLKMGAVDPPSAIFVYKDATNHVT